MISQMEKDASTSMTAQEFQESSETIRLRAEELRLMRMGASFRESSRMERRERDS